MEDGGGARAFLRELLFGSRVSGRLRKKLKTQSDAVLLLLLEHRATQRRVLVANCHLYWDPHFPHVKVAQAELVTTAINHFAVECRQRSGVAAAAAASADAPADVAPPPPALVLCGDFNSTPHHQPGFLPEVQRAQTPPPPAASHSAVYELLRTGTLAPLHPEHPDSFGMAQPPGSSSDAHDAKRAKTDGVGPLVAPTGALVDAYRDALAPARCRSRRTPTTLRGRSTTFGTPAPAASGAHRGGGGARHAVRARRCTRSPRPTRSGRRITSPSALCCSSRVSKIE